MTRVASRRPGPAGPPGRAVQFWFEFASTYSYPAAMRIEEAAEKAGVRVTWHAFLLGPIFRAQGWDDSPFNLYPAKGRYMWRDLERLCAAQGLPFRRPSRFPRSGLLAARVACHFADEPWLPAFVRGVYRAQFAHDQDVATPEALAPILARLGQDPERCLADATAPEAKAALRRRTEEAAKRGIFGAPSFRVGEELFWGGDRLEQALAWAARRAGDGSG